MPDLDEAQHLEKYRDFSRLEDGQIAHPGHSPPQASQNGTNFRADGAPAQLHPDISFDSPSCGGAHRVCTASPPQYCPPDA